MSLPEHLIFFDGSCGVCDSFVAFVIKNDTEKKFHFCPLNSDLARSVLPEGHGESSIGYLHSNELYLKSTAVALVLEELSKYKKLGKLLRTVPSFIRNPAYDFFAHYRRVWGQPKACALLGADDQVRILTGQKTQNQTGRIQ